MKDLLSMTLPDLITYMEGIGEKKFRAGQVYDWLHRRCASSYDQMTNIPKTLKEKMAADLTFAYPTVRTVQESRLDGTRKYLFRLSDGNYIESVLMKYHHGNTVCISSQCGCRMGCKFCASTLLGLTRNLTAGEMLSQVYAIQKDTGERVSNVVVMGTGEPLDNYDNLVAFLRMISDPDGLHISERNLTVSTCGLIPGIERLRDENLSINLALSLHAPNDKLRKTIMPIARAYSLKELIPALKDYYAVNKRRLTFEYSLIRGVNDTDACAQELADLIRGMNALVNLIPVNPVRETGMKEPSRTDVLIFQKKLEKYGINVTIRREMGRDIDGACGQLRKRYSDSETENDNL
jgi:23S rRNA (adenine2503-C2)-methyltransferase